MLEEKKIVIVSDENDVVTFDDITIKHDTINRVEVAEVKKELEQLENEKIELDNRIVSLKAKLMYADKIIAIADENKASESTPKNVNATVSEGEASILADAIANDKPVASDDLV
ncbi:MAG: hypothetical protein HDT32_05070 [Clostridiales bacterium]|nr:hypothetical protein [Clostridiales bacterium]